MKILWVGTAALVGLGVLGVALNSDLEQGSGFAESETVVIDGQEFKKTKDGRYNVDGTPTLFIDNSRVHTKYLSFNDEENGNEPEADADPQSEVSETPHKKKTLGENADELARKIEKGGALSAYNPATAAKFAETLKQTQDEAKERKKTLDELAK